MFADSLFPDTLHFSMSAALQAILASALSSLLGLTGGFLLIWKDNLVKKFSHFFISFAAGAMIGAAFFDLIVEANDKFPDRLSTTFAWVMVGFFLFFIIERILFWHHHSHSEDVHSEQKPIIPLIIIGDSIHNFIDGTVIAGTFLVSPALGIATSIAVFFHEIPQEIGDFSIMIHSGMRRQAVVWWNLLGALVSPIGTIITLIIAERVHGLELPLVGIAAGNFIYIAAADLIPEIHREKKLLMSMIQLGLMVTGLLVIVWLSRAFAG